MVSDWIIAGNEYLNLAAVRRVILVVDEEKVEQVLHHHALVTYTDGSTADYFGPAADQIHDAISKRLSSETSHTYLHAGDRLEGGFSDVSVASRRHDEGSKACPHSLQVSLP